jgi:GTPase SAR1 family protein
MATDGNGVVITHKYKIVFVGNISVGKTSILNRFTYDNFAEEYTVLH